MTLLITLADFPAYLPFSVNIKAELVNPYIREAQLFDLWPLLPEALRTVLLTARADWPPVTVELFDGKIKPLLVCQAATQMMLWHGTHVTPAGLEEIAGDGTRTPISPARRAVLSANVQAKVALYRPLLEAALRTAYPAPGAARCGSTNRRPNRGGSSFSTI